MTHTTCHRHSGNWRREIVISSGFWGALLIYSQLSAAPFERPDVLIETTAHDVLEIISARRQELIQDPSMLEDLVDELLLPHFDTAYAGQLALGKHARAATSTQRREFEKAFYRSILRTYATGLLEFTADTLTVSPFKGDVNDSRVLVRTKVLLTNGTRVPVDYRLRMTNDGWKLYDVIIEGISYITNYRKSVAAELTHSDLDSLIERLNTNLGTTAYVGSAD